MRKVVFASPPNAAGCEESQRASTMDREHLLGLIVLQEDRSGYIARILINAKKSGEDKTVLGLGNRLDILESYWAQYERDHALIRSSRDDVIKSSDYIKQGSYQDTFESYMLRKLELQTMLGSLRGSTADGAVAPVAKTAAATPEVSLPRIPIPRFSGAFDEWLNFRNLFEALVVSNSSLAAVHKLHYLKESLSGEPACLLRNYPLVANGYDAAWAALCDRYDNRRHLVDGYLASWFAIPPVQRESVSELLRLLDRTCEVRSALQQLGRPVDQWDDLMVHHTVSKLAVGSRRDWEKATNDQRHPVPWDVLVRFLNGRVRE